MLTVILPGEVGDRLGRILEGCLSGVETRILREEELSRVIPEGELRGKRLLFAAALDAFGMNPGLYELLSLLRRNPECLKGSVCGMVIDGQGEWYTKAAGRELSLALSMAGGLLPGKPLVEGTGSLHNQEVTARNLGISREEAYAANARDLAERIDSFVLPKKKAPKLLCLHASEYKTSNTLQLWQLVKENLAPEICVQEISLRNGEINDCAGCPFQMCMHFSKKNSCYYGGTIVDAVYPAVEACDGLILLCPNYNDAVSANISAFINRLTALFRKRQFYEKQLFAIVVSGYSGGDLVAEQLLGSLSLNKTFILPPGFVLSETANAPGEIMTLPDIREKAVAFGERITRQLLEK